MSAVKKLNIVDIENGLEELANRNLSPEEYGKELIALFSSSATLKRLGTSKANTSEFENGLLWREKIHYVPCAPGQLNATIDAVKKSDKTLKAKVRLVVVNDGSHILVYDRKYDELTDCTIDKIKDEPQLFLPLAGQEGFRREVESEVDIKATGKLAKVYDALIERNPEWLEGGKRHALNHFMTQIIFCLFAEDTGIFPKDIFTKALKNRAGSDGEHATQVITEIFGVLDLDEPYRKDIASWLMEFPYVNGGLFSGEILIPVFTSKAYRYLLETAALDWKHINPDILGSSIQAIVDPTMRGNLGMHYTSVPNILKTLEPLFLNELRDELLKARHSKKQINAFLERLSKIVVFDPACGSGNFLVIAYRELRKLELQALDALRDLEGGASLAFGFSTVISLSNFYGIEYADFAAETAKLALWIAEYQQNARFEVAFGTEIPALPLRDSGNILCNNALRVDWKSFCSVSLEQKVFLVGNPPYLGSGFMNGSQKEDMRTVFGDSIKNYKTLDYVTAWFYKGCEFIKGTNHELAFVATNSVSQGSQVETLWPSLFRKGLEIGFAHLSFKWSNNAANNAAVICVIIGMRIKSDSSKFLFNSEERRLVKNINGYLLEGPDVAIRAEKKPINGMPLMQKGNQPTDGGNLILSAKEKDEVIENWPDLSPYIKRIVGSKEIINGGHRFCFWFDEGDLEFVKAHPGLKARINAVTEMRLSSPDKGTQKLAEKPHLFRESRISTQTLGVPSVSSENRPYLPVEVYDSSTILTNLALAIYDAKLWHFALVASKLHYVWITTVCGRLKTDFRYSSTLGWHTFPVPSFNTTQIAQLEESAKNILIVRESHFPKTIAQLYDKSKFPEDLRQAHEANDALIEKMYRQSPFQNDSDRLEHLFKLYVDMTQGSTL
ncbi:DNA methyltransferase [Alteromonas macleodii]|uniref:class I SAM-dependent DNA methyltransferase n=1 Tax=Alteromonas macleodii TaxID=28108 RepID=UPI002982B856|nr:DNA methyltransferase [Alteromonas macleodii]MDW5286705.1 DNA methyltransferase [Alteromonas macleodii]